MRTKENAHDYRYFPEPDLVPVELTDEQIEAWRSELPELPDARRDRMMKEYGITEYDAAANAYDGFLHVYEVSAPEENNAYPAIKCKFRLMKNGKLQGSYYLRLDEGKELRGEMTLQKESALNQYAE